MINEVRGDTPIYRFEGTLLDISQIWCLFIDRDNHVYVNGVKIASFVVMENYIELEKKFFSYRGYNYDR